MMRNIPSSPAAAPAPLSARLRRSWHAFVSEHLLEVEPDWTAWPGSLRAIVATTAAGALKAS